MTSGRLGLVLLLGGVAATLGAAGCFTSSDDGADATNDITQTGAPASASEALKSTLILEAGCTAAKVGPRQLLLAARCVSGNKAFAAGQVLKFKIAEGAQGETVDAGSDAAAVTESDAGTDDAAAPTTATDDAGVEATIASVTVHPTFAAACTSPDACAIGSIGAAGVKDIAVVTLSADLTAVPTIPVDLDIVGQADPVVTVGGGCTEFDGTPGLVHTTPTIAVPAKTSGHFNSPFQNASFNALRSLDVDYIVTPAVGWQKNAPGICRGDLGAPLFRGDKNAVAGITAGFTTYDPRNNVPVTLEHTRVDSSSTVGPWLASLGATTIRSCNGKCAALSYDGGMPDLVAPAGYDGGAADSGITTPTMGTTQADLGSDTSEGYSTAPAPTYDPMGTKKSSTSACSATPGLGSTSSGFGLAFGVVLAIGALRRRR